MKTIQDIRKSFRDKYNKFVEDMSKLNNQLVELARETDDMLGFMETTIKLKEELKVPKPE